MLGPREKAQSGTTLATTQSARATVLALQKKAGKAAEEAEQAKFNLYSELAADFNVVPVATETFGSWGPGGLKFIGQIGDRIATRTGEKRSRYYLLQRISMAIQKGNVASIVGTEPNHRKLDEIFYL